MDKNSPLLSGPSWIFKNAHQSSHGAAVPSGPLYVSQILPAPLNTVLSLFQALIYISKPLTSILCGGAFLCFLIHIQSGHLLLPKARVSKRCRECLEYMHNYLALRKILVEYDQKDLCSKPHRIHRMEHSLPLKHFVQQCMSWVGPTASPTPSFKITAQNPQHDLFSNSLE